MNPNSDNEYGESAKMSKAPFPSRSQIKKQGLNFPTGNISVNRIGKDYLKRFSMLAVHIKN